MRIIPFEFKGSVYPLLYNGAAMFAVQDKYGVNISDIIFSPDDDETPGAERFKQICTFLTILAEQGELYRRHTGHTPNPMLELDELLLRATPMDHITMRGAAMQAVISGLSRDENDSNPDEEIDLFLRELEKKSIPEDA